MKKRMIFVSSMLLPTYADASFPWETFYRHSAAVRSSVFVVASTAATFTVLSQKQAVKDGFMQMVQVAGELYADAAKNGNLN